MVESLLGLGLTGVGSLVQGVLSARRANQATATLESAHQRRQNWYAQAKAGDYINRTDAQSALAKQRDLLNEQYRQARATNIVSGGSEASLALQKQLANQSLAQTTSSIASSADNYKDSIDSQRIADDATHARQMATIQDSQSQRMAQAGGILQQAGAGLIADDENPWTWLMRKKH